MPKYKRVKSSKYPTIPQLSNIPENLSKKLGVSVLLRFENWSHNCGLNTKGYDLSLVPGFNNEKCTIFNFTNWSELINQYHFLMER